MTTDPLDFPLDPPHQASQGMRVESDEVAMLKATMEKVLNAVYMHGVREGLLPGSRPETMLPKDETTIAKALFDLDQVISEQQEALLSERSKVGELQAKLDALTNAYCQEVDVRKAFDKQRGELQAEVTSLKSALEELYSARVDYYNQEKLLASLEQKLGRCREALEFSDGAIRDAIACEDGLDGKDGEAVLGMIQATLNEIKEEK